jgi:hypothetical protein
LNEKRGALGRMYECLQRVMGGDMTMVNMLDGQLEFFKGRQRRFFGSEVAQLGLENKTPTKLWESCGDEHLELHFIIYIYILRFWLRSCYPLSILQN